MNEKLIGDILNMMDGSISGFFADRDSLHEATTYAIELLKSSDVYEREVAVHIALGVYHNTLTKLLRNSVHRMAEDSGLTVEVVDD